MGEVTTRSIMERIFRSTVSVVVLARESDRRNYGQVESACKSFDAGLDALAYDINEGPCLGQLSQGPWEPIPDDQIETACQELGNDGTFFDDNLDWEP